jgi:UDP-N-acetylmuramate--alanine ligase
LLLAQDVRLNSKGGVDFSVDLNLEPIGEVSLQVAGDHNVNNALAAIAVALHEGLPFEAIARALANFPGVERRFELRGQVQGVTVIDDYAHHPTEIQTTLAAAKQRYPGQRIWAVWQPHTYSRVKAMLAEFATCFGHADGVVVLDIYRSRERDTLGLTPEGVAKKVKHPNVQYGGALAQATALLLGQVQANDVVITLNAGDARVMGDWLLDGLRERQAKVVLSMTEDSMGDYKDKGTADESQEKYPNKIFKLYATAAQVRRLVDRLKKEEEKKGSTKQDSDVGKSGN